MTLTKDINVTAKSAKYDFFRNKFMEEPSSIFNFLNIYDYDTKEISPFKPYPYQIHVINQLFTDPSDKMTLKGRQIGFTEVKLVEKLLLLLATTRERILVSSIGDKESKKIITRLTDLIQNAHPIIKYLMKDYNPIAHRATCGDSFLESTTTTLKTGTSENYTKIYGDEFAKVEVDLETFYASLLSTMSKSRGNHDLYSSAWGMNYFYTLWMEAVSQVRPLKPTFLSWQAVPSRDKKWYELEKVKFPNLLLFKQEHPSTPDEAFIASGSPMFDNEALKEIMEMFVQDPIARGIFMDEFQSNEDGPVYVWEWPEEAEFYYATIDGAEGTGNDYFVSHVINARTNIDVAMIRSNVLDIDVAARWAVKQAQMYNNAMIICERNSVGKAIINTIYNYCDYGNMYRTRDVVKTSHQSTNNIGFQSTGGKNGSKEILISCHAAAINNKDIGMRDEHTVKEHMYYYMTGDGKMEAAHGWNDDCVISRALGSFLIKEYPVPDYDEMVNLNDRLTNFSRNKYRTKGF